jgi:hypothetical protein
VGFEIAVWDEAGPVIAEFPWLVVNEGELPDPQAVTPIGTSRAATVKDFRAVTMTYSLCRRRPRTLPEYLRRLVRPATAWRR